MFFFFFFNDTATTEIYTLSLHDALPIWTEPRRSTGTPRGMPRAGTGRAGRPGRVHRAGGLPSLSAPLPQHRAATPRSEEHTSELQSRQYLVCRLLLEKKKKPLYIDCDVE